MDDQPGKPNNANKIYTYIVAGIVVLALACWVIYAYNHQNNGSDDSTQQAASQQNNSNSTAANVTPTTTPNTTGPTHTIKEYEAALIKYAKVRIQFLACQARPDTMTLKNPATIMLDNRSKTSATIRIDKKPYVVAGLDYAIVTISEPLLPVHTQVECNASQNVATLLIEK